jgi:hypothetical protein
MMPSVFSWLDYSEDERQQTLKVIDCLRQHETIDDLGIGAVRDNLADLLFPGTTTVQTRAKYFLFVPWTYVRLERDAPFQSNIAERARREELTLSEALTKNDSTDGVIGQSAGKALKRLPSNIYWHGLRTWGIRPFEGSQAEYHRLFDALRQRSRILRNDDGEPVDNSRPNWDPGLPDWPDGFPRNAVMQLSCAEARYIRNRICSNVGSSLLAQLATETPSLEGIAYPWGLPAVLDLRREHREQLLHAHNFSQTIHGAALLYNLLLADALHDDAAIDKYESQVASWQHSCLARPDELSSWDIGTLWHLMEGGAARVTAATRLFVERFLERVRVLLQPGECAGLASDENARDLVRRREWQVKGQRARLRNRQLLESWRGAAGAEQLTYRWFVVSRIITDIRLGLSGGQDAESV